MAEAGRKFAKCHPDRIVHAKGLCRSCYDKQLLNSNPEYRQRVREYHKKWDQEHINQRAEYQKKRSLLHLDRDKEVHFKNHLKRRYNLSLKEHCDLIAKTNNTCYICGNPPHKKGLHVDHSHKTGKVRGLLCARCNWYLAVIEKDPTILNKIKDYLEL